MPTKKKQLGRKFDGHNGDSEPKPRWELLPWKEVEQIVEILTFGSKKYEDHNWKHVRPMRDRYFGALQRHLTAWFNGEKLDPESGKNHLAHAGCCLLFLMWGDNNRVIKEEEQTVSEV